MNGTATGGEGAAWAYESLVVTIEPENATNKTIKWTSSNPEIATVDDNGNVIGKSPGKVTITA
ncbi:Ig-like domain-containing protein [Niallia circulans]|uniref:Ig-like domain-containing protein n=1 Tax=Niallia circulans TaxID=1397 RepID=UPI0019CF99E2|nr:Ig-like domain-containing protein [Niallia circulans]